jgi:hypothetical protein
MKGTEKSSTFIWNLSLIVKGGFGSSTWRINLAANKKIRGHQIFNNLGFKPQAIEYAIFSIFFLDLFHETHTSYHIANALSLYLFSAYHKRIFRF